MSSVKHQLVNTAVLETEEVRINGTTVNKIARERENSYNSLVCSKVVYDAYQELTTRLNTIDPDNVIFKDNSVITLPVIDPLFDSADGWVPSTGFELLPNDYFVFTSEGYVAGGAVGEIKLPTTAFTKTGRYLLKLTTTNVENCSFKLIDGEGTLLAVIKNNDSTFIHLEMDGSTTRSTLRIVPMSYSVSGAYARFTYCGIHFVTERFHQYLSDIVSTITDLDGGGYVTVTALNEAITSLQTSTTNEYETLRETLTELYYRFENLSCDTIDAATRNHTHTPESIGAAPENHTHTPSEIGAAPVNHEHTQYVTNDTVGDIVDAAVASTIDSIVDTAPMLFLSGAVGVIPTEFREYNIVPPIQVILPSVIVHNAETPYDFDMGWVSSPQTPVEGHPLANFVCGIDGKYVKFTDQPTHVHYTFHIERELLGYRIIFPEDSKACDWWVYSDLNEFVHHVSSDDNTREVRVVFMEAVSCNTLTFKFDSFRLDADLQWGVRISPIFKDIEANSIGFTDSPVRLASSNSGHTSVYDLVLPDKLAPAEPIIDAPLYIYTDIDHTTGDATIGYTYVRPEYGTIPFGSDILANNFSVNHISAAGRYINDMFGSIAISEASDPDAGIAVFDDNLVNYDCVDKRVNFYFVFDKTPLAICGYELFWKCTDADGNLDETIHSRIPEAWTLVITTEEVDEDGVVTEADIVLDSVNVDNRNLSMFGSNDVTYYKHFKKQYYVKTARLTFTTTNVFGMVLTRIKPMLLEDFYCIPENTMYHLDIPKNRFYLGTATYREFQMGSAVCSGYTVKNQVLGKHCSIPVNNLNVCEQFSSYVIDNPYNCKELSIAIRTVLSEDNLTPPHAVVTSVTAEKITISAYTEHRFVLDITRTW